MNMNEKKEAWEELHAEILGLEVRRRVEGDEEKLPDILGTEGEEEKKSYLFNVTIKQFEDAVSLGLDLNLLYMLSWAHSWKEVDWHIRMEWKGAKIKAWEQTLIRKGYLTEGGEITESGEKIYKALISSEREEVVVYKREKKEKKEKTLTKFDEWWKVYPATDNFVYKNKQFKGSQSKKVKKEMCMAKFKEIVEEGIYTADEVIAATFNHISLAKEESYRKGSNQVSFIANSERYLRERMFEGYLGTKIEQLPKQTGEFNI